MFASYFAQLRQNIFAVRSSATTFFLKTGNYMRASNLLIYTCYPGELSELKKAMNILVIDDEELICWSLRKSFERSGAISVHCAYSAAEAMSHLKEHQYDVIITDLRLPDAQGFDIVRMIQLASSEARVIVISSDLSGDMEKSMLSQGIVRCLSKPFDLHEILNEAWTAAGRKCPLLF
jgi:DNA-binding NtrC family response regulator